MGIGIDSLHLLFKLRQSGYLPTPSAVIEIGAQQLSSTFFDGQFEVDALGELFGVKTRFVMPDANPTHIVHGSLKHLEMQAPFARGFYEWLGFRYASIDIDGSPGSVPIDLNYDAVPRWHRGKYQMVTNFGTTEHVANQLNAFRAIHELTAPNGIMYHQLPSQGMFNHGLVNYNPKFFWMLARSNGYKFVYMDFWGSDEYYTLPQDVVDIVAEFQPDIVQRRDRYRAADSRVTVVMQKTFDIAYVAPIDVPTGTRTNLSWLERRYWTVLRPNVFEHLEEVKERKKKRKERRASFLLRARTLFQSPRLLGTSIAKRVIPRMRNVAKRIIRRMGAENVAKRIMRRMRGKSRAGSHPGA